MRQRPYFVDNDFFKNTHNANSTRLRYFCIKEREVTEWEKYSEEKEKMKKSVNNKKFHSLMNIDKIIMYFFIDILFYL